jgi:anti-sigma regulatory factor (Ser/Thr protein kinase)
MIGRFHETDRGYSNTEVRLIEERQLSESDAGQDRSGAGLSERYPARPSSVTAARRRVAQFAAKAGASDEQLDAIRLATSEAVTNAVLYAYPAASGCIEVNAWLAGGELWVIVADDGCGFEARSKGRGLGQGFALISMMADDMWVHSRSSGGTGIRMQFTLDGTRDRPRGSDSSATRPASPRFSTTR